MDDRTTWRKEISFAAERADDDGTLRACTLTEEQLDLVFDAGWGGTNGIPFTAWTETRVYFPIVYDGSEWAGSAPRNPCDEPTGHQGGN